MSPEEATWAENDALFFERLSIGRQWEEWLCRAIRRAGHPCDIAPLEVRRDISEAGRFAGQADLCVYGRVIEVKSGALRFSSDPGSFPYGSALVDTVAGWEAKPVKPWAYAFISQETRGLLLLPGFTSAGWRRVRRCDQVRGIRDTFLEAPRSLLRHGRELRIALDWLRPSGEACA